MDLELDKARSIRESLSALGFQFGGSDAEFRDRLVNALIMVDESAARCGVSVAEASAALVALAGKEDKP